MYKKIVIQLLLLTTLFVIIFAVFSIYFKKEENIKETTLEIEKIVGSEIDNETGTLIKDLSYSFFDISGNYYELFCDFGKIDLNDSKKIFMTNVKTLIYLKNSSPIKITAKNAIYNKVTHETNYYTNVKMTHLIHKATSDNLDISFENNKAWMYNNIIYNKPGTQLTADRLEIDLITKDTKIFMDNKSEKIKIINET